MRRWMRTSAAATGRRRPIALGSWRTRALLVSLAVMLVPACGDRSRAPTAPGMITATVRFAYLASTTPRTGLPPSTSACVAGVGRTHIHPSWRGFARVDLAAAGAARWEITFADVPVNQRLAIRVSDGNVCDENPTGAATRDVLANDVRLVEIVPTPGSGTEPGLAFTVAPDGTVTP